MTLTITKTIRGYDWDFRCEPIPGLEKFWRCEVYDNTGRNVTFFDGTTPTEALDRAILYATQTVEKK